MTQKNTQKEVPKGTPKITKKRPGQNFQGSWRGAKNGAPSRVSKSETLLLFITLEPGRASQKETQFGDHFGDRFCKKTKNGGSRKSPNISSKKHSKVDPKMGRFGGHFETRFKAIRNLGFLAPPWTALVPFWGHFGGHFL